MKNVIAIKGFSFVSDYEQRQKIRNKRKVTYEDRKMQEVEAGEVLAAPDDLIDGWVELGIVEVTDGS